MRKKLVAIIVLITVCSIPSISVNGAPYGSNRYNSCTYNDGCNISISTSGSVMLSISPTISGVYTINKDVITVTTNNSTGYTLKLESNSASTNKLEDGTNVINATSGTGVSPSTLSINEWGYRIDNELGFGTGPTAAVSNQPTSSLTFAGVPLLGSSQIIKTTSTSALSGDDTNVWYGIRADITKPAGTYSAEVLYTAVSN